MSSSSEGTPVIRLLVDKIENSKWQQTTTSNSDSTTSKSTMSSSRELQTIKFRAGRVLYDEESKLAKPDAVQGIIKIKKAVDEDSFTSFVWSPKENVINVELEELLIIPGDVTWTHVKECKTGRVFELRFLSSGARHLFWSQEINENEDSPAELSAKDLQVFDFIQRAIELEEEEEEEPQPEPEVAAPIPQPQETSNPEPPAPSSTQPIYDLNDVFTTETLNSLIENADEDTLNKLYGHLPASFEKNKENLREVLFSNYFRRSAHNLSNALNNGGGFVVSKSLGYEYEGEGVRAYLQASKKQEEQEEKEKKGNAE